MGVNFRVALSHRCKICVPTLGFFVVDIFVTQERMFVIRSMVDFRVYSQEMQAQSTSPGFLNLQDAECLHSMRTYNVIYIVV